MLDCEIVPIGAGDFWIITCQHADTTELQDWCVERKIVVEVRPYWYEPKLCALIDHDHAAEFTQRFLRG